MNYGRVTPRSRQGTTGISVEEDLHANEGTWISPPDRVAAVTVAVHIPANESATFVIETSCNRADTIGENGTGGYCDNPFGDEEILSENTVVMILQNANKRDLNKKTGGSEKQRYPEPPAVQLCWTSERVYQLIYKLA